MTSQIKNVIASIATWHRRRTAIRELSALDDRTLRDIGLSRGEIRYVVGALLNAEAPASGRIAELANPTGAIATAPNPASDRDTVRMAA